MQFDLIDIGNLGENQNPNSYVSIDFWLDETEDLFFFADGAIASISGYLKLQQDIKLFLLSPQGTSLLDSTWGNPVLSLIGSAPFSSQLMPTTVRTALNLLKTFKDNESKLRGFPLEGSELIKEIIGINIVPLDQTQNKFNVFIEVLNGIDQSVQLSIGLS